MPALHVVLVMLLSRLRLQPGANEFVNRAITPHTRVRGTTPRMDEMLRSWTKAALLSPSCTGGALDTKLIFKFVRICAIRFRRGRNKRLWHAWRLRAAAIAMASGRGQCHAGVVYVLGGTNVELHTREKMRVSPSHTFAPRPHHVFIHR